MIRPETNVPGRDRPDDLLHQEDQRRGQERLGPREADAIDLLLPNARLDPPCDLGSTFVGTVTAAFTARRTTRCAVACRAMKVDGGLGPNLTSHDLDSFGAAARELEEAGLLRDLDGRDEPRPVPARCCSPRRPRPRSSSAPSIAVAFARSPMTLANTANDLQAYSGGRFILGLGSQIKPHIRSASPCRGRIPRRGCGR